MAARRKVNLSKRQIEVIGYCLKGFKNREIASRMRVTDHTVKYHLNHAYKALGIVSRYQLVKEMIE